MFTLSYVLTGIPDTSRAAGSDGIDSVPDKEQVLLKDCEAEDGDRDVSLNVLFEVRALKIIDR